MTYAGGAVREYGLKQRTISRFGLGSEVGCTQGILARRTMSATYNRKFSKYYDCITGHKDYETETQRLAGLIKEHVNKSGARLLDVGCGTGTHAALLKDKGFSVVGIDVSREMIEVAQDKHKGVKFLACDVADLNDQGFEFSYSLYNVVNCLGSLDGLMAYFKAISARLVPGALFFVEAWNPIAVIAVPPAEVTREFEVGDEKILRKVHPRPDFVNQRLELIYDISVSKKNGRDGTDAFQVVHELLLFTPIELAYCLEQAGFGDIRFMTALPDLGPLEAADRMLSVLCRKLG